MFGTLWHHLQEPAVTLSLRNGVRVWVTYMGVYFAALVLFAALVG